MVAAFFDQLHGMVPDSDRKGKQRFGQNFRGVYSCPRNSALGPRASQVFTPVVTPMAAV